MEELWIVELSCGCGYHMLEVDDMVINDWKQTSADCLPFAKVLPYWQDEILQWRANWVNRPTKETFQAIADIVLGTRDNG